MAINEMARRWTSPGGQITTLLEDADQSLTPRMRNLLSRLWQEWKRLQSDIEVVSEEIAAICKQDAACQRLRQIEIRPDNLSGRSKPNSSIMVAVWDG
jgi:hypothetical protein